MEEQEQQEFTNMERCANMIHLASSILRSEGHVKDSEVLVALYKIIEYRNKLEGDLPIENWEGRTLEQYNRSLNIFSNYIEDYTKELKRMGLEPTPKSLITISNVNRN